VIRVYDRAGDVIETHERFQRVTSFAFLRRCITSGLIEQFGRLGPGGTWLASVQPFHAYFLYGAGNRLQDAV
jgi:hypothetical protein